MFCKKKKQLRSFRLKFSLLLAINEFLKGQFNLTSQFKKLKKVELASNFEKVLEEKILIRVKSKIMKTFKLFGSKYWQICLN